MEDQRVDEVLNDISRKIVASVVREMLTPVNLEHKVAIGSLKKDIERHQKSLDNHESFVNGISEVLHDLKTEAKFKVLSAEKEKESIHREITRM